MDKKYGPIKIGDTSVSRKTLYLLGATVNGKPISPADLDKKDIDPAILKKMQFDAGKLEKYRSRATEDLTYLIVELASLRGKNNPSVFRLPKNPSKYAKSIKLTTDNYQRTVNTSVELEDTPSWVDKEKSHGGIASSNILQGWTLFCAIDGLIHGNDSTEAALTGSSAASDVVGFAGSSKWIRKNFPFAKSQWGRFAKTSFFKAARFGHGASTFLDGASVVYYLGKAINAKTPEEAREYFEKAGFSGASFAAAFIFPSLSRLSPALAARLGANPAIALTVAFTLIERGYSTARIVTEIGNAIPLDTGDIARIGIFTFTGQPVPQDISARYFKTGREKAYREQQQQESGQIFKNNNEIGTVVFGTSNGTVKYRDVPWYENTFRFITSPYVWIGRAIAGENITGDVEDYNITDDGDDSIDFSGGIPSNIDHERSDLNIFTGSDPDKKAIRFELGGGNDKVVGAEEQPNQFVFSEGEKTITGGKRNDIFVLNTAGMAGSSGEIWGGGGNDTVIFSHGNTSVDVDLENNSVDVRNADDPEAVSHYQVFDISNVVTAEKSETRIFGTKNDEMFFSNGHDTIAMGDGNNFVQISGSAFGQYTGGKGFDTYSIDAGDGSVSIRDEPDNDSLIRLNWEAECIQEWYVEGTSLFVRSLKPDGTPGRLIKFENVYTVQGDGKLKLHNPNWTFATRDGYVLKVDLPLTLDADQRTPVKAYVGSVDTSKHDLPPPSDGKVPPDSSSFHVDRGKDHDFNFRGASQWSTIKVDYNNAEIESVEATYEHPTFAGNGGGPTGAGVSPIDNYRERFTSLVIKFTDGHTIRLDHIPLSKDRRVILATKDGTYYEVSTPELPPKKYPGQAPFTADGKPFLHKIDPPGFQFRSTPIFDEETNLDDEPATQRIETGANANRKFLGDKAIYNLHINDGDHVSLVNKDPSRPPMWRIHLGNVGYGGESDIHINGNTLQIGESTYIELPGDYRNTVVLVDSEDNLIDLPEE